MKCSKCIEEKKTSRITPLGQSTTLMANTPYYDENGKFHSHNWNTLTNVYECSNGHLWETKCNRECPSCDFGRDSIKTQYLK